MRWASPKSLTGLMLLGLAFIAVPLLWAVVDAAIQIRSLSRTSQQQVRQGVQAARLSQSMLADINSLQRSAAIYKAVGDTTWLDSYRKTDQQLAVTRTELALVLDSDTTRRSLDEFAAMHNEIASAVGSTAPNHPAFSSIITRLERLNELAAAIVDSGNQQINVRLAEMKRQTASTQKRLFWQSALRSEERREGKSVDLGGRRIIKKKKDKRSFVEQCDK